MKTRWIQTSLLALAFTVLCACAPTPPKPERMPGEVHDPGRLEEAAAEIEDRAGNKEAARKHRQRAIAQRHECNFFTFLISLLEDYPKRLCAPPTDERTEPQRLL